MVIVRISVLSDQNHSAQGNAKRSSCEMSKNKASLTNALCWHFTHVIYVTIIHVPVCRLLQDTQHTLRIM